MNVIDYITITCNLKNGWLQITSDYMKKCNRLQLITITNYDYPISVACIVILLVAILYRDHVGFCVMLQFHQSTSWNGQSSLATYGNETKLGQNWCTSGAPNLFLQLWCNFVSLYWVNLCRCVLDTCI